MNTPPLSYWMSAVSEWFIPRRVLTDKCSDISHQDYADLFLRRVLVDTTSRVLNRRPSHRESFHAPYKPEMIHIGPWFIDAELAKSRLPAETFKNILAAESRQDYASCVTIISQGWDTCTPVSFLWSISLLCHYAVLEPNPSLSTSHAVAALTISLDRSTTLPRPIAFAAASTALAAALHLCVVKGLFRAQQGLPWLTQALIQVIALHPGFTAPRGASEDAALLLLYSNFACAVAATGRNELSRVVVQATEKRASILSQQQELVCSGSVFIALRSVLLHNHATLLIFSGDWPGVYSAVAELQMLLGMQNRPGFDARFYDIVELAIDNLDAEFREIEDDDITAMLVVTDSCSTDADSLRA